MSQTIPDTDALAHLRQARDRIRAQLAGTIVGQEEVVEQMLICLLARGHGILEGVPGLAKTLLVRSLAGCLSLQFNRIQFTPDLMPSDITGTEVMYDDRSASSPSSTGGASGGASGGGGDTGHRAFRFVPGPIFTNVLLADEINRTPPKTQAALLEGMQERQVSCGGNRHPLPDPFFVLATQNPIEQEGTYPLPEAQLDRFLMKIFVHYPRADDERKIYRLITGAGLVDTKPVLDGTELLALQALVRRVPISDLCLDYALALVRATRPQEEAAPKFIKDWVLWGVGPRGGQSLILAAKAKAALNGRPEVEVSDLQALAPPVLRHRLVLNYNADAQGQTSDTVIAKLLETVPLHPQAEAGHARVQHVLKA